MEGIILPPSCIISPAEHNQWMLQILVKLSEASCEVIDDISSDYISQEVSAHLASLKDDLTTTHALCSESAASAVVAQAVAKVRKKHGPLFVRVPGISSQPAPASSHSSVIPGTSSQQSPIPFKSAKRKKKQQKIHIFPHCGMQKTRKSDMDDHLATSHGIGCPRLCSFCGKNMKTKKCVKEHENKVQRKMYKHKCPKKTHKFGTQSIQLYKTHRVRHHGEERERSF